MWLKSNFAIPAVAAISFCLIGATSSVYADLGDQLFKLLADDGGQQDNFGWSVAISGETAIVGARLDDDNGSASGSGYLFDISDPNNPVQLFKLLANDGAVNDHFGSSVAISGTTAIVGAVLDDDNGTNSGSAYLFDTTTGLQIAKLLPDDGAADDQFGKSVAISGETGIVGAWFDDDNGPLSGSAYLFDIGEPKNPFQIAKLLPDDGAAGDQCGWSVAITSTTAIVGAPDDNDNGNDSGSAYLFDASTGEQITKLLADDGAAGDAFGLSVAITGDTAIVGAVGDDDNGTNSGSAYRFDISDPANPAQIAKLLPNDGAEDDLFGYSLGISDDTIVIAAPHAFNPGIGSAYLFDTTTGEQIAKLIAKDGGEHDEFGFSVAMNEATAIVGASQDDNDNGDGAGSAYLFDAATPENCPWDLHGDGFVGPGDVLILFGWWGFDPGGPPDFDENGDVGVSDLLILLDHWGPCP